MTASKFIQEHQHKSINELALILNKKPELDATFILAQINGIQKAKNKLPQFYNTSDIIYPVKLSLEQCSSEKTGIFKSELIKGDSLLDLTGGFGVDSFYFSRKFKGVTCIEQNEDLCKTVQHNFSLLNANNIKLINATTESFITNTKNKFDVVYIDPSRRNQNNRVFKLDECTPNIIDLAPQIFKIADKILVKTAPLLDIKQTLKNLKHVTKVWIVSINNDCKEVLYLLEKDTIIEPQINTINLSKTTQKFSFDFLQETTSSVIYSDPENFLYEPNASILKAGAFNCVCSKFNLKKIAKNSHLYTSEKIIKNFTGRSFKIKHVINYNPKEFKKLNITKANVSCRNFKENVEQIKKKLKVKDGGKTYIFATTNSEKKPILIICVK